MKWPFKTIKKESSWPLHPILIGLAGSVLVVPEEHRKDAVLKTIERVTRLAARLAVEFGIPPCIVMDMTIEQLIREGGKKYEKHMAMHAADSDDGKALDHALDNQNVLTDFLTNQGTEKGEDGSKPN